MMQPNHSPIQEIKNDLLSRKKLRLLLKRDDCLHPDISGNKWRKIKYNLVEFRKLNYRQLLTFGGAFSNHIAAVAAAGQLYNFATIGIIRGEQTNPLNPTLTFAQQCGMQLKFISRTAYRLKNQPDFLAALKNEWGDFYLLPEGGSNIAALRGCREIIEEVAAELPVLPDYFCVPCGTGTTMAGIVAALQNKANIIGFSALKGDFLPKEITDLLTAIDQPVYDNWQINTDYHFGGYAKWQPGLIDFINQFKLDNQIALDPVYTGKMMYGIVDLISKNYFREGSTILAVHTGGLQGIEGFNERFGRLIA